MPISVLSQSTIAKILGVSSYTFEHSVNLEITSNRVIYVDASEPSSFYLPSIVFYDLSGNARNGTLSRKAGVGTLPAFKEFNGGYFSFEGFKGGVGLTGSSYIGFDATALLPLQNTPSTITTWVRLKSYTAATAQYRYIFSYGTTQVNGARWIGVSLENTTATFITGLDINRQPGSFVTASNFTTNEWFQVSQVYSSGSLSLYVNGALQVQKTGLNSNVPNLAVTPRIGMNCTQPTNGAELSADGFFYGDIAQVTVYNRALTAEEIWQNYKVTRHKFRAPDVGVPIPGSGGPTVPTVLTITAVPDIYSATTGLQVLSVGSGPIQRQGILWGVSPNIKASNTNLSQILLWPDKSLDINNPSSLTFNTTMAPLSAGSIFYYIAFAINSAGIGWGEEKEVFTLNPGRPTVRAISSTLISVSSVNLTGELVSINGSSVFRRGLIYSKFPITTEFGASQLDIGGSKVEEFGNSTLGQYTLQVTGLDPNTLYYYEAFAENTIGIAYSLNSSKTFTTPAFATIVINQSSVTSNQIVILVTTTGQNITNQGVVWNTTGNPTLANQLTDIGAGVKTNAPTTMTPLVTGTTYYIRGYVKNNPGGNITYTTPDLVITTLNVPTVLMVSAGPPLDVSSPASGNITSNGGQIITEKGFLASDTTLEPILTTSGVKKVFNTINATGLYSLTITGLTKGTTYYVRAYANNASGTGYSQNVLPILTLTEPAPLTEDPASNILANSAILKGLLPVDGLGNDVSASVGFQYSLVSTPLIITTTQVSASFVGGQFQLLISGLTPGTNYRFRAYATNSVLTGFGEWVPFTTVGNVPQFTLTSLTSTGLQFSAQVTIQNNGGVAITQKGIVWSTITNPTVLLSTKTERGAGTSNFTDTITSGIVHNTTYFVKAYVVTYDTFYTVEQQIQIDTFPTLTLNTPTNVTNTSMDVSVTSVFNGRDTLTERGVVWSTAQNPTTTSNIGNIVDGLTDTSNFSASLSGLSPGVTYYIRAYAINSVGTGYSAQVTRATSDNVEIITLSAINISATSATLRGEVLNKGTRTITARGVIYSSTNPNPTGPKVQIDTLNSIGQFSGVVTSLTPNTLYNIRAYADTSTGNYLAVTLTFTTLALTQPSVSIGDPTKNGLSFTVFMSSTGDLITDSGLVWSLSNSQPTPTINDNKVSQGSGIFSGNITVNTGLQAFTQYSMRAYATNASGTVYSIVKTILIDNFPTVVIFGKTINQTDASIIGNVTDNGGVTLTERGVIYKQTSVTTAITIGGAGVVKIVGAGVTTGQYTINITPLIAGTSYQIRAYAINPVGTAYSEQEAFVTDTVPTVTTDTLTNTALSQVQAISTVSDNGGANITERGVLYSTTVTNPTWATTLPGGVLKSSEVPTAPGTGAYTRNLTSLNQNVLYYIRAYAVNNIGPGYGVTKTITTWISPNITTNNATAITINSVTINGNITSDGGSPITSRGFYFGTINPPTNVIGVVGTTGAYSSNRTGLSSNTSYYFQAWCINALGTTTGAIVQVVTAGSNLPIVISSSIVLTTDNVGLLGGDPIAYSIGPSIPAGSLGSYFFNMQASSSPGNLTEVGMVSKAGSQPDIGNFDNISAFGEALNQPTITVTRGQGFVLYNQTTIQNLRLYAQNSSGYGYSINYQFPMFKLSLLTAGYNKGKILVTVNRDIMLSGYNIVSQGLAYQDTIPTNDLESGDPYFDDGVTQYYFDTSSIGSPSVSINWNNGTNNIVFPSGTPFSANFAVRAFIDVEGPAFGGSTIRFWSNKLNTT